MLRRLIVAIVILLLLFLFVAKRGAGAQNLALAQSPPEGAVLLLNLPNVYILPSSPFYFLVRAWQGIRLFLADSPSERANLFLSLAEARMAEVIRMQIAATSQGQETGSGKRDRGKQVLTLIQSYQKYVQEASRLLNLVQDPTKREQLLFAQEKQTQNLALFKNFLNKVGIEVNWEVLVE